MDMRAFDCFKKQGSWYKGNLHSHTVNSDGFATPEQVVDWYSKNGYDFLAITDHDFITDVSPFAQNEMLVIPGIEFGYRPTENPDFYLDMLGVNISSIPSFLDPDKTGRIVYDRSISPQKIIDAVNAEGGLAIMCHPYFMINMTEPYMTYHSYIGMEAYNYVCEEMCGRGYHEVYWDAMLKRGRRILGFASDDSHWPQFGYAWIEVKAKEKSIPAILQAIREGEFYSTTGIKIFDIDVSGNKVKVSFDRPCDAVFMPGSNFLERKCVVRAHENTYELIDGKPRFFAEAEVPSSDPYFRIELIDSTGKKAYTNPVYFR